jgi:hypothetical protein
MVRIRQLAKVCTKISTASLLEKDVFGFNWDFGFVNTTNRSWWILSYLAYQGRPTREIRNPTDRSRWIVHTQPMNERPLDENSATLADGRLGMNESTNCGWWDLMALAVPFFCSVDMNNPPTSVLRLVVFSNCTTTRLHRLRVPPDRS